MRLNLRAGAQRANEFACRRLVTSHAFHSAMMDPIIEPFTARVKQIRLSAPQIPYVSGVTGQWITEKETTDPAYWARHFRQAVQFSAGVTELRKNPNSVLLEVGPGNVLSTLARQHTGAPTDQVIVSSLSDGFSGEGDAVSLMSALGALWLAGAQPDWTALHEGERRQRISLPTYPFERKRYWLDAPASTKLSRLRQSQYPRQSHSLPTVMEELDQVKVITQTPAPTVPVGNAPNRKARLRAMLAEIFEDLSGMDLSQADGSTTFLEMGFDSLFLTQVTQALQSKFGLKITFRQLLGDQVTLDALAGYVDSNLPANAFPEFDTVAETAQSVSSVAATTTPAIAAPSDFGALPTAGNGETAMSESPLERLLREQLQAMNQLFAKQLEAVRVDSSAVAVAAPAPTIAAPAQTASAVVDKDAKELKGYTPFKALTKGPSAELTPRQQQYIAEFVDAVHDANGRLERRKHKNSARYWPTHASWPASVQNGRKWSIPSSRYGQRARSCGMWTETNTWTY